MEPNKVTKANEALGLGESGFRLSYNSGFQYPSSLLFKGIPSQKITRRRGEREVKWPGNHQWLVLQALLEAQICQYRK